MGNLSFLSTTVNFDDIPDSSFVSFSEIDYGFMIVDATLNQTQSGGTMLIVEFQVVSDSPVMGKKLKKYFNIVNDNPITVKIALQELKQLSTALGMQACPDDTNDLINKYLVGSVKLKAQKEATYTDANGVVKPTHPRPEIVEFKSSNTIAVGTGAKPTTSTQQTSAFVPPWAAKK